ncbi:MAG: hypothetical protein AAFW75_13130 [Cyanobacteria bacterium J06636_16]
MQRPNHAQKIRCVTVRWMYGPATSDLPELARTMTRLEAEIDRALRHLCMDEKITKEVWFEAAYQYLVAHPKAMKVVNGIAKERYQRRKRAAELRKLETMQKRLKG